MVHILKGPLHTILCKVFNISNVDITILIITKPRIFSTLPNGDHVAYFAFCERNNPSSASWLKCRK